MGLDIRLPIGMLFGILGALLILYGLVGDQTIYQSSLGININLWWGVVMLIFGVIMAYFGRRGERSDHPSGVRPAMETPEGRATEEREHRLGLEKE
jgi:hypothetical protein